MRPTWPLLLMTGLQGLAGGIFTALALAGWILGARTVPLPVWADMSRLALVLVAGGGAASVFHMHRLQGARYVLARLGSSWLSREVATTGLFGLTAAVAALGPFLAGERAAWYLAADTAAAVLGLVAMFVTAMIYATIPAMLSWHTPLTVLALTGAGIVSGGLWVRAGWMWWGRGPVPPGFTAALAVALITWGLVKALQARVFHEARGRVRAETGWGLPLQPHRLQDTGTSRPPYRTQPQVWPELTAGRRRILWSAWVAALVALAVTLAVAASGAALAGAGLVVLAVYVERWLFFGDATHSSRVFFPRLPSGASPRAVQHGGPAR
jgi:DMSO reductase anchor subunit